MANKKEESARTRARREARRDFQWQQRIMRRQQEREQQWSERQARQAQEFNRREARHAERFSAQQAREQMQFQERMSSTAHQREMEDLQRAGLNPILAAGGAGAAAPSGSAASGVAAQGEQPSYVSSLVDSLPQLFSIMQNTINSAREAQKTVRYAIRGGRSGSGSGKKPEEPAETPPEETETKPETMSAPEAIAKAQEALETGEAVLKTKNYANPEIMEEQMAAAKKQINDSLDNLKVYVRLGKSGYMGQRSSAGVSTGIGVKQVKEILKGCAKIYGMTQAEHQQKLRAARLSKGKANIFDKRIGTAIENPTLENIQRAQDVLFW